MAESPTVRDAAEPSGSGASSTDRANIPDETELPGKPTDMGRGGWGAAARRTLTEFKDDFLQDRAAALTYYGVQAIFPGILVLVSLLGLAGQSATQPLITNLANAAPTTVRTMIPTPVSFAGMPNTRWWSFEDRPVVSR